MRCSCGLHKKLVGNIARSTSNIPVVAPSSTSLAHHSRTQTQFGAYLERSGTAGGDALEVPDVIISSDNCSFSWHFDLPQNFLSTSRSGMVIQSPPFNLGSGSQARFQFYPKGDSECQTQGMCSLWVLTDHQELSDLRLSINDIMRTSGSSEFCSLKDAVRGGVVEVRLELTKRVAPQKPPPSRQSLQLTGLQLAQWKVYQLDELLGKTPTALVTSQPFRFHHVLLGDMYLEAFLGVPYPEYCTLFFQCRVPTMKLQVDMEAGSAFQKSFVASGMSSHQLDQMNGNCLQVNLAAPGVLNPDGDLTVRCRLEKVISLPANLQHMIPQLDARAKWPKRL